MCAQWRRAALWAGNVHEVICEAVFNNRAHQPPGGFFIDRTCRRSCSLQNGAAPFGDIHEASKSVSHDPAKSQWPMSALPREPICLSTNTRIVPSSSCIKGKPAVMPCSYTPSPSSVVSRPRASLTPNSKPTKPKLLPSDVTPLNHPPLGVAC